MRLKFCVRSSPLRESLSYSEHKSLNINQNIYYSTLRPNNPRAEGTGDGTVRCCTTVPDTVPAPSKKSVSQKRSRGHRSLSGSQSVSGCFEPSQPQRITSGLSRNFNLSPSYSFHKSLYHKSFFTQATAQRLSTISERKTKPENKNTCIGAYLYSIGNRHGNLHLAG